MPVSVTRIRLYQYIANKPLALLIGLIIMSYNKIRMSGKNTKLSSFIVLLLAYAIKLVKPSGQILNNNNKNERMSIIVT